MLIETEAEERFVVIIFIIGGISIWGLFAPLGYVYDEVGSQKPRCGKFYSSTACKTSFGFAATQGYSFVEMFLSKLFFAEFLEKFFH